MPQVIIDPDEARNFANYLEQTIDAIRSQKSSVTSDFDSLNEVWRDHKYDKFSKIFFDAATKIDSFINMAENYVDYLRRKAEKADRYLEDRY